MNPIARVWVTLLTFMFFAVTLPITGGVALDRYLREGGATTLGLACAGFTLGLVAGVAFVAYMMGDD